MNMVDFEFCPSLCNYSRRGESYYLSKGVDFEREIAMDFQIDTKGTHSIIGIQILVVL
jgi:hypothetical protein